MSKLYVISGTTGKNGNELVRHRINVIKGAMISTSLEGGMRHAA